MTELAIKVEGLGKRYRIGQRERYLTLRDVMTSALKAPLRFFNGASGNGQASQNNFIWSLKDVSLEIKRGEAVGLIGRNGAGKTTLLKILARVTRPTEGRAEVRGRIGSLLEVGTGFHPELTGRENTYLNGAILGMSRQEIARKFDEIVAFSGVEAFIDTPLKHYSSGMQTRLAFSVAAHLEPEILLVDEVLAVGDQEFQKKCLGKMKDVSRGGRTVLFVSHQMNQIRRLCEKVIWINGGRIEGIGPAAKVIAAYEAAIASGAWAQEERGQTAQLPAHFLQWSIVAPQAEQPNLLTTLGVTTVEFRLQVNQPLRMGRQGIALYNGEGQLIWAWAAENLRLEPGPHELRYTFPMLPLKPGLYNWHVTVWGEHGMVDSWHCMPEMIVATEIHQHPEDAWNGVLNLPCEFSVRCSERSSVGTRI